MIAYFDTSALVPLIIDEPISDAATRLWDAADRIVNSRPAFAEARAALARARRMGRLGRDSCQTAVRRLETLVDEIDVVVPEVVPKATGKAGAATADETDDDDEEEPDDEDVEASLDTILKERLVVEEPEDDEDTPEPEDRTADGVERVLPKQPGEFVCRSCFLVKHPNQLADRKKMLCRDCV